MSPSPISRPLTMATDLDAVLFEDVDVSIPELMARQVALGMPVISGRTFRRCRLLGPSIVLVGRGTLFDDTNFGNGRGQVGNLLLRPLGDRAIGATPLIDCVFQGCEFHEVGFTGDETFLQAVLNLTTPPQFGSLS